LARFARGLREEAPPLARIEALESEPIEQPAPYTSFEILHSEAQAGEYQLVSPDIATCPDCLREIMDPRDRRYRYPFTNCTNCGPRFTIIEAIPYDRPKTTMKAFAMCPACQREYDDPLDRRFHAQPNACPVCGPHLTLVDCQGRTLAEHDEALREAERLLREGAIVAIKGLGGFQLACDATNEAAVARLRVRKRRPHKPFAV
ncbi:MAG: carbamoyltransferase HypF, partial [Chloroflexi bacterium]|nr:carbamoyltransferase HypF [Chloroflexota bacterium]